MRVLSVLCFELDALANTWHVFLPCFTDGFLSQESPFAWSTCWAFKAVPFVSNSYWFPECRGIWIQLAGHSTVVQGLSAFPVYKLMFSRFIQHNHKNSACIKVDIQGPFTDDYLITYTNYFCYFIPILSLLWNLITANIQWVSKKWFLGHFCYIRAQNFSLPWNENNPRGAETNAFLM